MTTRWCIRDTPIPRRRPRPSATRSATTCSCASARSMSFSPRWVTASKRAGAPRPQPGPPRCAHRSRREAAKATPPRIMAHDQSLEELSAQAEQLREQLRHHNYRYYVLDDPDVSDAEYDALM